MYAIFKDGGHQHKAEVGRKMFIELRKDVNVGDTIEFNEVLLVGSEEGVAVGQPNVEGGRLQGDVARSPWRAFPRRSDRADQSKHAQLRETSRDVVSFSVSRRGAAS